MSRTRPTPPLGTIYTSTTNRSTPPPDTSSGQHWTPRGLGLEYNPPATTAPTLLPLFGATRYPSLPREGATSRQSHSGSGQTSPTPVTAPQSPINDNDDNGAATPAGARIEEPLPRLDHSGSTDPFNWEGPDYEWNSLEEIDERILGPERVEAWELRRADVEARTGRHHPHTREDMAYYLATHRGVPFHFGEPSDSELMARAYANRNRELFRTHPGQRRPDLRERTQEEESILQGQLEILALPTRQATLARGGLTLSSSTDWDSVYPGFFPRETVWGDPRPMADSPPNPRYPRYYTGAYDELPHRRHRTRRSRHGRCRRPVEPTGSTATAGAAATTCPTTRRTDQLIQQVALLWDENLRLQNDVADLRQHANQRGRPGAPPY